MVDICRAIWLNFAQLFSVHQHECPASLSPEKPMQRSVVLWILGIAVIVAMSPALPYGYYTVMRWVVCALAIWLALSAHRAGQESWTWSWVVIAGIYNPIVPVHADRNVWFFENLLTATAAAWFGLAARPHKKTFHE